MANNEWTDSAADAAGRAAARRETGGAVVPAGGTHAPADVTIPGRPEHEGRVPGRSAGTSGADAEVPRSADESRVPGQAPRRDPEVSPPVRGPDAEEAPELLGERSDYPLPFGEDPGTIEEP